MTTEAGVYRPVKGRITVYGPESWVRSLPRHWVTRNPAVPQGWFLPRNRFHRAINSALSEFGRVRVIIEKGGLSHVCDTRCQEANPDFASLCECVCLGSGHGRGPNGYSPSGTTAVLDGGITRHDFILTNNEGETR